MATTFKLLFLFLSLVVNGVLSVIVETPFGKLEGTTSVSRQGKEFYSFRGIPYAEKAGRFEIAQPVKPWTGVKKATDFGNACPQFDSLAKTIIGSEDCNFLNVYSIKKARQPNGEGLPVMVWFHPGAFVFGKSDDYDPRYFMDENVIIVTLNYRMGVFGFLDTGDDSVPPNLGLRDQVLALEFVQKAIESFGGDPSKVTIFGCSAGGASVSFHLLSKMSKGLFRNGISQSGTALAPWSLQRDPAGVAKMFAEKLNCNSEQFVECLKSKTMIELIQAQLGTMKWFILPFSVFVPSVEKEGSKFPRFLESDPWSSMKAGKFHSNVPWMNGFVEDEGALLSTPVIMDEKLLSEINEDWSRVLPIALEYDHITNQEIRDNVSSKILQQYFGNEEISEETWTGFTNLFSDRYFIHSTDLASRLYAKFAPTYPFQFTFPGDGDSPILKNMFGISGDYGIGHSDELQYLFNGAYGAKEHVDKDKHEVYEFSERFVKLWASFAKNNKPTATWKNELDWKAIPSDIGNSPIKYYDISPETKLTDGGLKDRIAFWNKLDVDNNQFQSTKTTKKDEL